MDTVVICVCTFNRVLLLQKCLESLSRLKVPDTLSLNVAVIDNDIEGSSSNVVINLQSDFPFPLIYENEPKRGIPCARNKAINVAHSLDADFIVFIDDDEEAEKDWLDNLFGYCQSKGGRDVVHGAVKQRLPEQVPDHVRQVYQKAKAKTGDELHSCATNNVIVPIYLTKELELRFDESVPLAGGTDTIFFAEARARGVKIFECSEAVVHESIPESRATLRWLSKRKFRAGITEAWRKHRMGRSRLRIVASSSIQCVFSFVEAVLMVGLGRYVSRNRFWLKSCRSAGMCAGAFGLKVESYKVPDGQ